MRKLVLPIAAVVAIASASAAVAATTISSNFNASITIQSECKIQSLGSLSFGTFGVLDTAQSTTATLAVQCTNKTPYDVSLVNGSITGSINSAMTNANGEDVAYSATLSATGGTGNGNVQNFTITGDVAAQTTPSPATYTDTKTVYVTY